MFTNIGALVLALLALIDGRPVEETTPICVMVGAYKCAPVKVEVKCMTPDSRANWYDRHCDAENGVLVVTLIETTRAEQ